MWLNLTYLDGTPVRINLDMIEAISPDTESNGSNLSALNCGYQVKESFELIQTLMMPVKEWK